MGLSINLYILLMFTSLLMGISVLQRVEKDIIRNVRLFINTNGGCGYSSAKRFIEDAIIEKLEREQLKRVKKE